MFQVSWAKVVIFLEFQEMYFCYFAYFKVDAKELINKNLDDGMDKDAYIDVSKFDFDNCNSDDYE